MDYIDFSESDQEELDRLDNWSNYISPNEKEQLRQQKLVKNKETGNWEIQYAS